MSEDYSINSNQLQVTKEGLSKYEDIVRNGINHKILSFYTFASFLDKKTFESKRPIDPEIPEFNAYCNVSLFNIED
jgi:hypothetical protein